MAEPVYFKLRAEGVTRGFGALIEELGDLKAPLREHAKYLAEKLRAKMASQGGGSWPGYAPSTLRRMGSTGTSRVTTRGTIRKGYEQRLVAYEKKLRADLMKNGATPETLKRLESLQARVEKLRQQKERVRNTPLAKRKKGSTHLDTKPMLGALRFLRTRIKNGYYVIGAPEGTQQWAGVHNYGEGRPRRQFIPEELDNEDVDKLVELLEEHLVKVWEETE